jgi:hypothetical protein
MEIRFGNYTVKGTRGDWTVSEAHVSKGEKTKGEERDKDAVYYGTFYQCLAYLLNAKLGEADKVDVRELKQLINTHCIDLKHIAGRK